MCGIGYTWLKTYVKVCTISDSRKNNPIMVLIQLKINLPSKRLHLVLANKYCDEHNAMYSLKTSRLYVKVV